MPQSTTYEGDHTLPHIQAYTCDNILIIIAVLLLYTTCLHAHTYIRAYMAEQTIRLPYEIRAEKTLSKINEKAKSDPSVWVAEVDPVYAIFICTTHHGCECGRRQWLTPSPPQTDIIFFICFYGSNRNKHEQLKSFIIFLLFLP